ncbi:hypothetical protein QUF80_06515 [Desulfococcaceae bacterium HSG8]|nr:hypothetical protein [Desulfococcaceae bacterium HSG8]
MNKIMLILAGTLLFCTTAFAGGDKPVVLLIEAKGKVMYSANGETWKDVRRNKFLFEGWRVRTGNDGSCKLLNQRTEMLEPVGGNTELEIRARETKVTKGDALKPEPAKTLAGFLNRKFAKVQKYTSLRRYGKAKRGIKLATAANITLSDGFSDLVWESAGPEYSYRLTVGEKFFDVPKSGAKIIRFKVPRIAPGNYKYRVQLLFEGEVAYTPGEMHSLRWLSAAELENFRAEERRIHEVAPNNGFLIGNLMDEHGFKVAAMDQYRTFLSENPESDEVRPFLVKVLNELELKELEESETGIYQSRLKQ